MWAMTQTPAAGWFVDPEDATQFRYWDGTAWTEHRSPRGPTTTDQLSQAGSDLADGLARGFTAVGTWVNQNTSVGQSAVPTFASVAASCRDEPARQPLSATAQLVQVDTGLDYTAGLLGPVAVAGPELTQTVTGLLPRKRYRLVIQFEVAANKVWAPHLMIECPE